MYSNPFITLSINMYGQYYIILADDAGAIERISCDNYTDKEKAEEESRELARCYNVRVRV